MSGTHTVEEVFQIGWGWSDTLSAILRGIREDPGNSFFSRKDSMQELPQEACGL